MRFIVKGDKNLFEQRILSEEPPFSDNSGPIFNRTFWQSGENWSYLYVEGINFITEVSITTGVKNRFDVPTACKKSPIVHDWGSFEQKFNIYSFMSLIDMGYDDGGEILSISFHSSTYKGYYEQIFFI